MQRELVEEAQRGSQEAFAALVHGSADRLYAIAYRILRDADRADDALQQALIAVWEDLPDLRDPGRFEAWSYRVLVRAAYREARRDRRAVARIREIRTDAGDGEAAISAVAARDEVDRSFRHLTPEHRAVLVLHFYLGLSIREIADTLGIPLGTAASRLHHAVRSLRAAWDSDARGVVAALRRMA